MAKNRRFSFWLSLTFFVYLVGGGIPRETSAVRPRLPEEVLHSKSWPFPTESGAYQARLSLTGELLWEVTWTAWVTEDSGQTRVHIREEGQGQPLHYEEPIRWEKRIDFKAEPSFLAQSIQGSRFNRRGELLSQLEFTLDSRRGLLVYRDAEPDGHRQGVELTASSQLLPDELLFHWVRTLAFDRAPAGECLLLVSPNRRFRMRAWVRGTESVTTPAGTFDCYRVELVPFLGPLALLPIKHLLVPKLFLWVRNSPPHFWVRYQGPIGGPGTKSAVIELVRFEPGIGDLAKEQETATRGRLP